jgi:hypothetical protein
MGLKIEFDNPALAKGEEVGIVGVGLVKNGGSVTITDAQVKALVDELNVNKLEDEKKATASDLFKGDMFKTTKVADPDPPDEEAENPGVVATAGGTFVNTQEGGES